MPPNDRAPIVLLHEGLGSVSAWADFPDRLAFETGRRVLAHDRAGYGRSGPHPPPWSPRFMHDEAGALSLLLRAEQIERPLLVGHSDGATVALLYPAMRNSVAGVAGPAPLGIVSMSAHAFVEDICVREILRLRANDAMALRKALARRHDRPDDVFEGWSEVWTSARFRDWTIDDDLAAVVCPILLIQGSKDTYSAGGQLERIEASVNGLVDTLWLECDHWPHREATEDVLAAIGAFCHRVDPMMPPSP